MKSLIDYIREEEAGSGMATPATTMGMGNPDTECFISAPEGGTPHQRIRITKRRKKSRKGLPDYDMSDKRPE